jgi:dTDP-glucose pyrophosphorylase
MSGVGKRFVDAGYADTKSLIVVDEKPIIQHVVEMFDSPDDVIFICNEIHLRDTNMESILQTLSPNCKILPVPNENRKGPVDAVNQVAQYIDDDREVIVSYCDYGTSWDYSKFLKQTREANSDGAIACYTGFHPHMLGSDNYAFVKMEGSKAAAVQEKKPFTDDKISELASNGTYYFKNGTTVKKYFKELVEIGDSLNGEYYVSLVYNLLIRDSLVVTTFLIDKMLQWGTPYDLENYRSWSNYFNNLKNAQPKVKNPQGTTLLLPMAGRGSRFEQEGYSVPKPLIEVNNLPMIIQAVNCLPQSDNNVFMCLEDHIEDFGIDSKLSEYYPNTRVVSINETTQGQASTCQIGIDEVGIHLQSPILISACDNGVYYDSQKYLDMVNDTSVDIIVWTFRNNQASKTNPNAYAWLDVDADGFVKHVSCKNFIYDNPLTTHAIVGTMFFRKCEYFTKGYSNNIKENIRTNGEFYVDDVLNQNIKDGLKVKVFEVENYICWGTPNDFRTYNYWKDYFTIK